MHELGALPKVAASPFRKPVESPAIGRGKGVLVLPGMASGDWSTAYLRHSLAKAGFRPVGSGAKFQLGLSRQHMQSLEDRLTALAGSTGGKVAIIGWSLGGLYARVLAQRHPDLVDLVVTLGTPFSGDRHANNAWRLYNLINDHTVDDPPFGDRVEIKPAARTIAIWSPVDGIVAPACARGQEGEADRRIELPLRHFELGTSRKAVGAIVDVLAEEIGS